MKTYTEVYKGNIDSIRSYTEDLNAYLKSFLSNTYLQEISLLYQEVINRFKEINKLFGFNHPLEIYAAYIYLLKKGYFSKNKHFEYGGTNFINVFPITGVEIIAGYGVCRHIVQMLESIYTSMNIKSTSLSAKQIIQQPVEDQTFSPATIKFMERILSGSVENPVDDEERKRLINYLKLKTYGAKEITNVDFSKIRSNHVINYVVYEGRGFLIDPNNSSILKRDPSKQNIYIGNNYVLTQISRGNSLFYKNYKNIRRMGKLILQESDLHEQDLCIVSDSTNICNKNEDILLKFYENNSDLYDEIGSKLLSL